MTVERFRIHVSDHILDDLKERLHRVRWPDQFEGSGCAAHLPFGLSFKLQKSPDV